jgi:hypothetical protein
MTIIYNEAQIKRVPGDESAVWAVSEDSNVLTNYRTSTYKVTGRRKLDAKPTEGTVICKVDGGIDLVSIIPLGEISVTGDLVKGRGGNPYFCRISTEQKIIYTDVTSTEFSQARDEALKRVKEGKPFVIDITHESLVRGGVRKERQHTVDVAP